MTLEPSDTELLTRFQKGDWSAFKALSKRYYAKVYPFAKEYKVSLETSYLAYRYTFTDIRELVQNYSPEEYDGTSWIEDIYLHKLNPSSEAIDRTYIGSVTQQQQLARLPEHTAISDKSSSIDNTPTISYNPSSIQPNISPNHQVTTMPIESKDTASLEFNSPDESHDALPEPNSTLLDLARDRVKQEHLARQIASDHRVAFTDLWYRFPDEPLGGIFTTSRRLRDTGVSQYSDAQIRYLYNSNEFPDSQRVGDKLIILGVNAAQKIIDRQRQRLYEQSDIRGPLPGSESKLRGRTRPSPPNSPK